MENIVNNNIIAHNLNDILNDINDINALDNINIINNNNNTFLYQFNLENVANGNFVIPINNQPVLNESITNELDKSNYKINDFISKSNIDKINNFIKPIIESSDFNDYFEEFDDGFKKKQNNIIKNFRNAYIDSLRYFKLAIIEENNDNKINNECGEDCKCSKNNKTTDQIIEEEQHNIENRVNRLELENYYTLDFDNEVNKKIIENHIKYKFKNLFKTNTDLNKKIRDNTISKNEVYILRGWLVPDINLKTEMTKYNSLATCVYCMENFNYELIEYFKKIPYQKCKVNNLHTNNLFCCCQKCFNLQGINNIYNPPKTFEDIKFLIISHYGDIHSYNHTVVYRKEIMKQKKHLDKLKQEYEQNVSAMNYYTAFNEEVLQKIEFEKEKHDHVVKLINYNKELTKNYYNYVNSAEKLVLKNSLELKDNLDDIINTKLSTTSDRVECKICMTNNVELALPCGHLICEDCLNNIKFKGSRYRMFSSNTIHCPHCRQVFNYMNTKRIFLT